MIDINGTELEIGDEVVFANFCGVMQHGVIVEIRALPYGIRAAVKSTAEHPSLGWISIDRKIS